MQHFNDSSEEMMVDENENLVVKTAIEGDDIDNCFGSFSLEQKKTYEKRNYFKLQPGDNIYRIMPPMFDGLKKGTWAVYYSDHYGFKDSNKKVHKFLCTRKYNEKGIMGRCLICEDQEEKKKQLEVLNQKISQDNSELEQMKNNGVMNEPKFLELQDNLDALIFQKEDLLSKIRPRNTAFYVNAMDQNGNFGLLGLKKTIYEALVGKRDNNGRRTQGLLAKLKQDEEIEPLSPNEGVWFNFFRSGKSFMDVDYKTDVVYEIIMHEGRKLKSIKKAPLTTQQKQLALSKCQNLLKIFDYLDLSLEEQSIIINGSPDSVTAVLNNKAHKFKNKEIKNNFTETSFQQPTNVSQANSSYIPSNEELSAMIN